MLDPKQAANLGLVVEGILELGVLELSVSHQWKLARWAVMRKRALSNILEKKHLHSEILLFYLV